MCAHGIVDASLYRHTSYGSSLNLKVPGIAYPGIYPGYRCFDARANQEMMQTGEVKFSRHWVLVLEHDKLYLDPTFSCYYSDKEAILAPETSDR